MFARQIENPDAQPLSGKSSVWRPVSPLLRAGELSPSVAEVNHIESKIKH